MHVPRIACCWSKRKPNKNLKINFLTNGSWQNEPFVFYGITYPIGCNSIYTFFKNIE